MKKNRKIQIWFIALATMLFTASCEKDEIIVETFESNNPKVKEVTFRELSSDTKFINAFSKISKNNQSNNSLNRTVMENQYNFTIDDYPAKVIELDSLTSYTFSINNQTRTSSAFENLVVNHYTNGITKAAIIKYIPNQNNTINDSIVNEHNSKHFEGTTEITPIIYNANNINQRQTTICFTSNVLLCNYGGREHPAGERCGTTYWGTQTTCETIFTAPDYYTSIIQIIEDTGNNNGGATSVSVGMALADNFANTQLTPEQKLIYDSNPSIREYLANNIEIVDIPNYNPLLGGDSTMAIIKPEAEQFTKELIDLANNEEDEELIPNLINLSIVTKQNGYFENSFDTNYYNLINPYTEVDTQAYNPLWSVYFTTQCAIARYKLSQEPEWNNLYGWQQDAWVYWEASKEMLHLGLDLIGLVPVVGEVADLTNGVIYTIEGDGVNATLSFASTIPIAGWFSAGVKFAKRADGLAYTVKAANNLISFGAYNSKKFRQACGIAIGDATKQAHHIIPRGSQIIEHEVVQRAAKATTNQGFHIDQALNGIAVATWRNQRNHHQYNNKIYDKLQFYIQQNPNATPSQCYNQLMIILNQAKQAIINNPNVHLNNLNF